MAYQDIITTDAILDAKPTPPAKAQPVPVASPTAADVAALTVRADLAPLLGSIIELASEIGRRLVAAQLIHSRVHAPLKAAGKDVPSIEAVGQWVRNFLANLGDRANEMADLFEPLNKN